MRDLASAPVDASPARLRGRAPRRGRSAPPRPLAWSFVLAALASLPCEAAPREVGPAPAPLAVASASAPASDAVLEELGRRPLMPLSEVKAGMEGEAWTVFQGTRPEPFKVRVVAVLRSFLPKQDLVLVRAEDPRVEHSGIVAGMSGSPVYVDRKLVGAIAYAWSFAKEPLGGVTPIASMLADAARPLRGTAHETGEQPAPSEPPTIEPVGPGATSGAGGTPAGPSPTAAFGTPHLQQVAVPLAFAGFPPSVIDEATPWLRTLGLTAWQGGGGEPTATGVATGAATSGSTTGGAGAARTTAQARPVIGPGSAIGVELVRGDMSAVAVGTVTTLLDGGKRLLAFGHPMMNAGEMALPLVGAEIHAFLPSLSQSFKMASPLAGLGVLEQDRPSCIVGRLGRAGEMVPVTVTLAAPHLPTRLFHAEIARNRRLTASLASLVLAAAVSDAVPDVTDVTAAISSTLSLKGQEPLVLRDQLFSSDGLSARALGGTRLVRALAELPANGFGPVDVSAVDVRVELAFQREVAEIVGLALPGRELHAGETVPLRVTLRPYGGREYDEIWDVTLPRQAAGREIKVEVAAGAQVKPDLAPPETLTEWLASLAASYPAKSAVISIRTDAESLTLRGRLLPGLPASALDTARSGQTSRRGDPLPFVVRTPFPTKRVLMGKKELTIALAQDGPWSPPASATARGAGAETKVRLP